MLVVVLIVLVIFEGLLVIMMVIFVFGVQCMVWCNVIVSCLLVVEMLGLVMVICLDKIGILICNEMIVQCIVIVDQVIEVSGVGYVFLGGFSYNGEGFDFVGCDDLQEIGCVVLLCNEVCLYQEGEVW